MRRSILYTEKIVTIFKNEGGPIPIGFTSNDVNIEVPKLYDNGFDIMLIRMIKEIAFSLRNDLPAKLSIFMKDIFEYAHEGAKIMINNGWMEEPLQTLKHK
ncbi:MAG: DUF3231 family protein [Bacillota bacterium]